jgi:hypothetical protein
MLHGYLLVVRHRFIAIYFIFLQRGVTHDVITSSGGKKATFRSR